MALEGTLRDFSLADIFQLISIQKKTGVLTLKDRDDMVTVAFLNGNVVNASSAKKNIEDRLGQVLVKSGHLSPEQLNQALRTQKDTLQRLGHVLVQSGYITEDDLKEALRLQVAQMVYRLFRWKDGDYHFTQEKSVEYDRDHVTPLSAESVLMEGIRMIDEWPIIERKIPSYDLVFRRVHPEIEPIVESRMETGGAVGDDLDRVLSGDRDDDTDPKRTEDRPRLGPDEGIVFNLIDGRRTVQDLIDRSRLGEFETCRILYDLLSRGLISTGKRAVSRTTKVRKPRVGPFLERVAFLGLGAWIVISFATMPQSPFSGSPRVLAPPAMVDQILDLVTRNRIQRLDEAVQIYYLQKGFYPDDLFELVRGRLVASSALVDPWGRRFGFISSSDGYRIIAYKEGGEEHPERSLVRGRPPKGTPGTAAPTGEPVVSGRAEPGAGTQ